MSIAQFVAALVGSAAALAAAARGADGLCALAKLATLDLRGNAVASCASLRVLSVNPKLSSLDVRGNPLCATPDAAKTAKAQLRSVLVNLSRLGVGPDADEWHCWQDELCSVVRAGARALRLAVQARL